MDFENNISEVDNSSTQGSSNNPTEQKVEEQFEVANLATIETLITAFPDAFVQETLPTGEIVTILDNNLDQNQMDKNWDNNPLPGNKWVEIPRSKVILTKEGLTIVKQGGRYNFQMDTLLNEIVRPALDFGNGTTGKIIYNRMKMDVMHSKHILEALKREDPDTLVFMRYLKSIDSIREK
jgi:hypothetical protein